MGNQVFQNCAGLTSVSISNSVPSIGNQFFQSCSSLTSVTIPNSVTSIGQSAFQGCSNLGSVTLSNSLTTIGSAAFNSCVGLSTITIPNSVTSIGSYAFVSCSGLTSVICNVSTPITIAANVFQSVNQANCSLAAPSASVAAYQAAAVWQNFNPIVSITTAPTASGQTLCSGSTVANLVATGTDLKWYTVATNGTALATTTAITTGTYYVSQTLNNNESERTSVAVTVNPSAVTSSAIKLSNASVHVTILPSLSNNWSVSGGLDQGLFSISNNTMLNFNSVANYNSSSSNVYFVNVSSGCTTRNLTITISPLCGKWD
jgi:hypothetical protein